MERDPTDPPRARADRARHWLALVADAAFLVACLFLLYTALGGEVRWRTALFRITLTETNRPTQICVLLLLIKAVFGLDRGLFASLATTRVPIVGPLAAVLHALDRRLRAVFLAYRLPLLVSATSLFVSLGFLELYLRHFPHTLPRALANHLTTPYHTGPSGIYRWAPEIRTTLMHPNHERTIYFNGYWWRHKTDSRGFRNPVEPLTASVVLLGDSIVYGHGVEEVSTIRHHLESFLGQPVANLGIQGSSIHNEYQVLKTFGLGLRPRYVFLFFLANDIDDLGRLGEAALAAFLDTAVSDHATPFFDVRPPKPRWWGARAYRAIETRLGDLSVVKAFDFLRGTRARPLGSAGRSVRGGLGSAATAPRRRGIGPGDAIPPACLAEDSEPGRSARLRVRQRLHILGPHASRGRLREDPRGILRRPRHRLPEPPARVRASGSERGGRVPEGGWTPVGWRRSPGGPGAGAVHRPSRRPPGR